MAVYEYECGKCKHVFEAEHAMIERPEIFCPNCGEKDQVHRVISASTFVLKGKGWSRDGYKK